MKITKKRIQGFRVIHAKQRFQERYGYELSREEYDEMIYKIQTNQANLLRKKSNTQAYYLFMHQKKDIIAIYSSVKRKIVTFITLQEYVANRK